MEAWADHGMEQAICNIDYWCDHKVFRVTVPVTGRRAIVAVECQRCRRRQNGFQSEPGVHIMAKVLFCLFYLSVVLLIN